MAQLARPQLSPVTWRKIEVFMKHLSATKRVEKLQKILDSLTVPENELSEYAQITQAILNEGEE